MQTLCRHCADTVQTRCRVWTCMQWEVKQCSSGSRLGEGAWYAGCLEKERSHCMWICIATMSVCALVFMLVWVLQIITFDCAGLRCCRISLTGCADFVARRSFDQYEFDFTCSAFAVTTAVLTVASPRANKHTVHTGQCAQGGDRQCHITALHRHWSS